MPHTRSCVPLAASLVLVLSFAAAARAGTVTSNTDAGPGSLRQVLADASDGDTIDFALTPPATIMLTTGELVVGSSVTITGPGVDLLAIDGNDASRVFHVSPGKTVTIAQLTVAHGRAPGPNGGGGCILNENATVTLDHVVVAGCVGFYGGGVLNDGEAAPASMQIVDGTLEQNQASSASGGAIYNDGSTPTGNATLEVVRSTISGNQAIVGVSFGGGIFNDSYDGGTAVLNVHATTISGNVASTSGGGIATFGAKLGHATTAIANCTFRGNSAASGGAIANVVSENGVAGLEVGNTILVAGANGGTIANQGGAIGSLGFNLASDAAGGDGATGPGGLLDAATDRRNTDALLGPLDDNGGPTLTHLPQPGSPAIDAGKRDTIPALVDTTDQRGFARPVDDATVGNAVGGDASDVGAVEVQPPADLAVTQLKAPARITLKPGTPSVTKLLKVQIQNRSGAVEIVPDLTRLAALVDVQATSLGGCAAPVVALAPGKNKLPAAIKPKKKLTVTFAATLDCANDPLKTSKKNPGHDDFHWVATVHRSALGGAIDAHGADDVCPHPSLPGGVDARPDLAKPIKDKGCGGKLPDKTLGAAVATDVVVK